MARFSSIEDAVRQLTSYKVVRNIKANTLDKSITPVVSTRVNNAYSARLSGLADRYAQKPPERAQSAYAQRYTQLAQAIQRGEVKPTQTVGIVRPRSVLENVKPTSPLSTTPTPAYKPQEAETKEEDYITKYERVVSELERGNSQDMAKRLRDELRPLVTPEPITTKPSIPNWSGTAPKPGDPIYVDAERTKTSNQLAFTNKPGRLQLFTKDGKFYVGLLDESGKPIEAEGLPETELKNLQPVKYYPGIEFLLSGQLPQTADDKVIRIDYDSLDYGKPVYFDPARNAIVGYETPFRIKDEAGESDQVFTPEYEATLLLNNLRTLALSELYQRPSQVSQYPSKDVTDKLKQRYEDVFRVEQDKYVSYLGLKTAEGEETPLATTTDYYLSAFRSTSEEKYKPTFIERAFSTLAPLQLIPDTAESILSDPRQGKLGKVVTGVVVLAQGIASLFGDLFVGVKQLLSYPFESRKKWEEDNRKVYNDIQADSKRLYYVANGTSERANAIENAYKYAQKLQEITNNRYAQAYVSGYEKLRREHDAFVNAVNRLEQAKVNVPQQHAIAVNFVELLETLNRPYMRDVLARVLRGEETNVPLPASVTSILQTDKFSLNDNETAGLIAFLFDSDVRYFANFYTPEQRAKLQNVVNVSSSVNVSYPSYAFLWYVTKKYGTPTINDILREAYSGDYLEAQEGTMPIVQANNEIIQAIASLRSEAYRYLDFAQDEERRQVFSGKQADVSKYTKVAEDLLYTANLADSHLFGVFGKTLNPFNSYSMTAEPSRLYKFIENLTAAEMQKKEPLELGELMRIRMLTDDAGTEFVGQLFTDPQTWLGVDIFFDGLLKPAWRTLISPAVGKVASSVGKTALGKFIRNTFVAASLQSRIYKTASKVASALQDVMIKNKILENLDYDRVDELIDIAERYAAEFGGRVASPEEELEFFLKNQTDIYRYPTRRIREIARLVNVLGKERARDVIISGVERGISASRYKALLNAIEYDHILTGDEKREVLQTIIDALNLSKKDIRSTNELIGYLQKTFYSEKDSRNVIENIFEALKNRGIAKNNQLFNAYSNNLKTITKSTLTYFNTGRIIGDSIYRNLASLNAAWENSPFLKDSLFGILGAKIPEIRNTLVLLDRAYRNFMSLWIRATLARFPSWAVFNYLSNAFIYITMAGKQSETLYRLLRFFTPESAQKILEQLGLPPSEIAVVWNALETAATTGLAEGERSILFGKNLFSMNILEHLREVYKENQVAAKSLVGKFLAAMRTLPDTVRSVNASIESYSRLLTYYEFFKGIAREYSDTIKRSLLRGVEDILTARLSNTLKGEELARVIQAIQRHVEALLDVSSFNTERLRKMLEQTFYNVPNVQQIAVLISEQIGKAFDITSSNSITMKLLDIYLTSVDEALKQGKKLTPQLLEQIHKQVMRAAKDIADELAATKMDNVMSLVLDDLEVTKATKERAVKRAVDEGKQVKRPLTPDQQVKAFDVFSEALDEKGNVIDDKISEVIKGADDEKLTFISEITGIPREQLSNFSRLGKRTKEKIVGTIRGVLDGGRVQDVAEREEVAREVVEETAKEVSEVTVTFGEFLDKQIATLTSAVSATREGYTLSQVLEGGLTFIDNSAYNEVFRNLMTTFDTLDAFKIAIRDALNDLGKFDEEGFRNIARQLGGDNAQAYYDVLVGFLKPDATGAFTHSVDDFFKYVSDFADFLRTVKANIDALFPLDKTNPTNFAWIVLEESGLAPDAFRAAEHALKAHVYSKVAEEVYTPVLAFLKGDTEVFPDLDVTARKFLNWLGIEVIPSNAPDKDFSFRFAKDVLGEGARELPIKGQAEAMLLSVLKLDGKEALDRVLTPRPGSYVYQMLREDIKTLNADFQSLLKLTWNDFKSEVSSIANNRKRNLMALHRFFIPTLTEDGVPLEETFPKRIANWLERKVKESEAVGDAKALAFYKKALENIRDDAGNLKSFGDLDTVVVFGYAKDWFERRHIADVEGTFSAQMERLVNVFSNVGVPEAMSKRIVKQFDDVIDKIASNLGMDVNELRRSFVVKLYHDKFDFATHWGVHEKEEIFKRVGNTIGGVRADLASGRALKESLANRFTTDEISFFKFSDVSEKEARQMSPQALAERTFLRSQYAERHVVYNVKNKGEMSILFVRPTQVNKIDYINVGFADGRITSSVNKSGDLVATLDVKFASYKDLKTLVGELKQDELPYLISYRNNTAIAVKNLLHFAHGSFIDNVIIRSPDLSLDAVERVVKDGEEILRINVGGQIVEVVNRDLVEIQTMRDLENFLENNTLGIVYDPKAKRYIRYNRVIVNVGELFKGGTYRIPFTSDLADATLGTIEFKGIVDGVKRFEIALKEQSNVTTIIHEMMHLFSYLLPDDDRARLLEQVREEVERARRRFVNAEEMPEWLARRADDPDDQRVLWEYLARAMEFKIVFGDQVPQWLEDAANYLRLSYLSLGNYFEGINLRSDILNTLDILVKQMDVDERLKAFKNKKPGLFPKAPPKLTLEQTLRRVDPNLVEDKDWMYIAAITNDLSDIIYRFERHIEKNYPDYIGDLLYARIFGDAVQDVDSDLFVETSRIIKTVMTHARDAFSQGSLNRDDFRRVFNQMLENAKYAQRSKYKYTYPWTEQELEERFLDALRAVFNPEDFWYRRISSYVELSSVFGHPLDDEIEDWAYVLNNANSLSEFTNTLYDFFESMLTHPEITIPGVSNPIKPWNVVSGNIENVFDIFTSDTFITGAIQKTMPFEKLFSELNKRYLIELGGGKLIGNERTFEVLDLREIQNFVRNSGIGRALWGEVKGIYSVEKFNEFVSNIENVFGDSAFRDRDGNIVVVTHYSKYQDHLLSLVPTREGIHLGTYSAALDRKRFSDVGGFYQYLILGKNVRKVPDLGTNDISRHLMTILGNMSDKEKSEFFKANGWFVPKYAYSMAVDELLMTVARKLDVQFASFPGLYSFYKEFLKLTPPSVFDYPADFIAKVEGLLQKHGLQQQFTTAYSFFEFLFAQIKKHARDGIQFDVPDYLLKDLPNNVPQTQHVFVDLDNIIFDVNVFLDMLFAGRARSAGTMERFLFEHISSGYGDTNGFLAYSITTSVFTKHMGIDFLVYQNNVEAKGSLSYMVFSPRQLKRLDSALYLPSTRNYDSLNVLKADLQYNKDFAHLGGLFDYLEDHIKNVNYLQQSVDISRAEKIADTLEQLANQNAVFDQNSLEPWIGKEVLLVDVPLADVVVGALGDSLGKKYEVSVISSILDVIPDAEFHWYYDRAMNKYVFMISSNKRIDTQQLKILEDEIGQYAGTYHVSPGGVLYKNAIYYETENGMERVVYPIFTLQHVPTIRNAKDVEKALSALYSKGQDVRVRVTENGLKNLGYDERFFFRIVGEPLPREIEMFLRSSKYNPFVLYVLSTDAKTFRAGNMLNQMGSAPNLPTQLQQTIGNVRRTTKERAKQTLFATFKAIDFSGGVGEPITLKRVLDGLAERFPNLAQTIDLALLPDALRSVSSTLAKDDPTRSVLEHLASIFELFNNFADDYIERRLTADIAKTIAKNHKYFAENPDQLQQFIQALFDFYGLDYGLRHKIYAMSISPTFFTQIEQLNDVVREMWNNQVAIDELSTFLTKSGENVRNAIFAAQQAGALGTTNREVAQELIEYLVQRMEAAKDVINYGGVWGSEATGDLMRVEQGAIDQTNKLLIDYTKRTPFDNIMRTIFPFWMYPAKSARIWLEAVVTRPYIMATFSKYIKLSETLMRQNVMVDSEGKPLNSYFGFVPIFPGVWINVTTPFLYRYALPRFYEDDTERFKAILEGEEPAGQAVAWAFLDFFPRIGLYPNPILSNVLRQFYDSQFPEPSLPYEIARLFLPLEYFPPFLQRSITYTLNKFIYGKETADMFLPNVSWMDYLVERDLLMQYYNRILETDDPEERERLAEELKDILSDPERENHPVWNATLERIQDSDWARTFIGRMTGFYAKPYTSAVADLRKIVREVRAYRMAINNAVLREILDIPDAPDVMYRNYIERAYGENPKAMVYSLYNTLNTASFATGKELVGEERRKAIAEEMKRIEENNLYYSARAKLREQLENDLMGVDIGDKEKRSRVYQKYFDSLAELDKQFMRTNGGFIFGYKPFSMVYDQIENKWWDYLKSTMPVYDGQEPYSDYKKRLEQWYEELPTLARALAPVFITQFNAVIPDNEEDIRERGLQVTAAINALLDKSNYEGYQEYRRKNDSVIEAVWEAFQVKYVDEYFKAIEGKTGQERYLAERQFFERYNDIATNKERIVEWVQELYGDKFTRNQILQVLGGVKVLDIDEALNRGKSQEEIIADKIWDLFNRIGYIGSNQYDKVIEAYKDLGGNVRLLDVFLTSGGNHEAFKNPNDLYNLYTWLQEAVDMAGITEPSIEEIKERVDAKKLDDQFKNEVKAELGADIFDLLNAYFQLSNKERQEWRRENPEAWMRIQKYYQMRDEFARANPSWAKYFHPNYQGVDKDGNVILTSGGSMGYTVSSLRSSRKRDYIVDYTLGMGRRAGSDIVQIMLRDLYGKGGATRGIPIYEKVASDIASGNITSATKTYLKESAKSSQLLSQPLRDLLEELERVEGERVMPVGQHGGGRRRTVTIE